MAEIRLRENENIDSALKRFNQIVDKEGILFEYRKKQGFVSNTEKKRQQIKDSIRRKSKQRRWERER